MNFKANTEIPIFEKKTALLFVIYIHANFSKSPRGILRIGTFRRTENSQHFVLMLHYSTIFSCVKNTCTVYIVFTIKH